MYTIIAIPSKSRWDKQMTFAQIPQAWEDQTVIAIPENQFKKYTDHGYVRNCLPVPTAVKSIGPTRQWIVDWANGHQYTKLIMMDDDLEFAKRRVDDPTKFEAMTLQDMGAMLQEIVVELDSYAHVSVLAREGGNRITDARRYNTRPLRVYAYNLDMLKESGCRFTSDPKMFMDDFDMTLKLLRKGYDNCVLCNYVHNQKGSNTAGGASDLRTAELQEYSAKRLWEANKDFVRLVRKETKTAWGWGQRTDVVIQWKKARDSAK